MRILIDMQGTQSYSNADRGIGRYTRSFVTSFIEIAKEHKIYLLLNGLFPESVKKITDHFAPLLPSGHILLFDAIAPAREWDDINIWNTHASELAREKLIEDIAPDLLFLTSLFEGIKDNSITSIKRYCKIPTAVIFYDLIPYMNPEYFLVTPQMERWYMRKIESLKRADLLLAISFSAQSEASLFLGVENRRLSVISSATDETFIPQNTTSEVLKHYGIFQPYLMHTSAYEERKNFEGLIEAFALLPEAMRTAYQLVLVCKLTPKQHDNLEKFADAAGVGNKLILTGYVSNEDLVSLYTHAELFVFPSLHEGFGLPVLEAMACGTATIGSDCSSIPEVIGREDALFDPVDKESIAAKIEEVLGNANFKHTLEMHARIQCKKFSWETTAYKALSAIEARFEFPYNQKPSVPKRNTIHDISRMIAAEPNLPTPSDQQLRRFAKVLANNEKTVLPLVANGYFSQVLKWRIEGPFDSSYSLALLNRETARALDALGCDVALHSTEGPGDFDPDPKFLAKNPDIEQLYQKSFEMDERHADVCSRNLYPPRVEDMKCLTNMLHHYAWEESGFPQEWVENFNRSLDGMTCLSTHVEKIMIDNGVSIPLATSGCGSDHWERITVDASYRIKAKSFCFLHVSSCFPRKGADVLLKAYGDAFSAKDDVSLVIKTFPNPHNEIHHWLKEAKEENSDYPEVIIIEEDLTDSRLKALYEQCHVLVAPSRAEGFGLPMAEAMLSGLPVITTAWGGQLDFCNEETAWLVDYDFVPAQTHFELFGSVWAEPSRKDLTETMQEIHRLPAKIRTQKVEKGRKLLLEKFTWKKTAENLLGFIKTLPRKKILFREPKIGWITSWNTQCGIASYSRHLIDAMPQEVAILAAHAESFIEDEGENVHRSWHAGDGNSLDKLEETIDWLDLDTLVLQFNYSFYDFEYFPSFIHRQCDKGRTIVVMLHSTSDAPSTPHKKLSMLIPALKRCSRVLVHTPDDLNQLKSLGLLANTALFPHGIPDTLPRRSNAYSETFTLASYGFFLPHKGLLELIETVGILKEKGEKIQLKMVNAKYPVPLSSELIETAKEKIKLLELEKEITLHTEYLSDEACLTALSDADLILFPYQETGESSSAAVRYGLASGTPVAVTPLKIFEDVKQAVYTFSGCTPEEMAESIRHIITEIKTNSKIAKKKHADAQKWCEAHRHSALGLRLGNMLEALS